MEEGQEYIKGFNDGYKLAKFQPELFKQVKESLRKDVEYDLGLLDGAKEFQKERQQGREDDLANIRKTKGKSKDRDLSR